MEREGCVTDRTGSIQEDEKEEGKKQQLCSVLGSGRVGTAQVQRSDTKITEDLFFLSPPMRAYTLYSHGLVTSFKVFIIHFIYFDLNTLVY